MFEAGEVIKKWLKDVEATAPVEGTAVAPVLSNYSYKPLPFSPQANKEDFLGSFDWSHGNVADNARTVVENLLRKDLSTGSYSAQASADHKQSHDPRVAMEMRHKKVKERRKLRDQRSKQHLESELLLKQAQREAEEVVRKEERLARERAAQEERLFNHQITLVRSQIRERRKFSQQLAMEQREAIERELQQSSLEWGKSRRVDGVLEASPAIVKAEEIIVSERKRRHTRSELIKQLEEAKAHDTKENIKLLHRCFSTWYESIVEQGAKLGKAVVVREWKLMMRVWGGWRRFVSERKARRERDMATREMQRMKREYQVASEHYGSRLLLKALTAWASVVRLAKTQREQLEEQQVHRRKMEALLKAATIKAQRPVVQSKQSGDNGNSRATHGTLSDVKKPPIPKAPTTPEPAVWKVAREQLTRLINEVDRIATEATDINTEEVDTEGVANTTYGSQGRARTEERGASTSPQVGPLKGGRNTAQLTSSRQSQPQCQPGYKLPATQQKVIKRPKPKPVTKPIPMKGMANRSAAILERRAAREERRETMLREKVAKLAQEEEERRKAELAAKEALIQQKREERRLAKQKEMVRLQQQQLQAELNDRASQHYHTVLLCTRGLAPWQRFVEQCTASRAAADELRERQLQRMALREWAGHWRAVVAERLLKAQALWDKILLRRVWKAWTIWVVRSRELEELAVTVYPRLLVNCVFRAWCRVSKEERMEHWEKMARARRFRQRFLQRQVLRVWLSYVPLAKEERAKELRRAELRRKVSSWLTDFQPLPLSNT